MEISKEIDLLLSLIEEHAFIYDKSLKGYTDDKKRTKCYALIAKCINVHLKLSIPCMY